MEITVTEFREKYLPELEQQFQESTQKYISENRIEIFTAVQRQMEQFLLFMGQFQETFPIEVGEIQVALLQTSVHMGKPQIAICAYDEKGILGNEIFNVRFDVTWLFHAWEDYRKNITEKIFSLNANNFIREEAVTQMMWYSMSYLQSCLYATLKYQLRYFWNMEGYDQLILAEKFRLTVGGYRDASKIVFMKTKDIDLFMCEPKEDLRYGRFYEVVYNKKIFGDRDLTSTYFKNCEFVHCTFENVQFTDAEFDECRFYHCSFENVDFVGATFQETTIKKCKFTNTTWSFVSEKAVVTDICKNTEINQSVLESLTFEKSNLCEIICSESSIRDCQISECENDGQVFCEVE